MVLCWCGCWCSGCSNSDLFPALRLKQRKQQPAPTLAAMSTTKRALLALRDKAAGVMPAVTEPAPPKRRRVVILHKEEAPSRAHSLLI